ncbi:MAG TPA: recombination-associated protein RdgC [Stellaceae bacterium]|nr:recombination-associated protein RdgC [Stellaceae bacterium]
MRSPRDLTSLIKFLARDDWKSRFEEVLGEHFGPAMQAFDLEHEEVGAALGGGWDMTLWGVAFEDFLSRQVPPDGRNFGDEYLRRRGWNESTPTKAYIRGLRNSIMSLYEVSAIVPGESFLARDLVRGGDPVSVSERNATRSLKEWDRIAARILEQDRKRILSGGLLPFPFDASERLLADLRKSARPGRAAPPGKKSPIAEDALRKMAPLFTSTWLLDVLPRALGLARPTLHNSDGDEVVFHEVRFPLAPTTAPAEVARCLAAISSLNRENDTFWNWLADPSPQKPKAGDDGENVLAWNVTMDDGRTVLGNVEIKENALVVSVNSAARAERVTALLRAALGRLVAAPLTEIQSIEQVMAEPKDRPRPPADIPVEIQAKLVHAALDRQYRALLDQPIPMLGNRTPRAAARTASGREKLVIWLKHLENRSRQQPDANDPMAIYDFAWLWQELKVTDLRR